MLISVILHPKIHFHFHDTGSGCLAIQAMETNQFLIPGIVVGILILGITAFAFSKKKAAALREKNREDIISESRNGKEKDFLSLARTYLSDEEALISDQPLLESVLRVLIKGGAPNEAAGLLTRATKRFPNQTQFNDLDLDLLIALRKNDPVSLERILAGYQRNPERKEWISRYVTIAISGSISTGSALKAIGDFQRATGDLKALYYLVDAYDKKKIYTETSMHFFEKINSIEPKKTRWYYAVGRCRQNIGNFDGAEGILRACLAIDETFQPAIDLLANLRGEPQYQEEAVSETESSPASLGEQTEAGQETGNGLPSRYVQISELGRGGMGVVYKAFDDVLKRWVAIKVLLESNGPNFKEAKERFLTESRIMASLDHPVIPKVFDVSVNPPCYLALEFLEGTDLRCYLESKPNIPLDEIIRMGKELSAGFQHAAEKGVLHRDIKPENILIEKNGRIRILDFGLARFGNQKSNLTQEGLVVGTPWYMAPERLKGDQATVLSEIFSYGVTFHEILTGKKPFEGDDFNVILFQDPKPIRQSRKDCPMELEVLILDCLSKNPVNRPRSFSEIHDELEKLVAKPR